MASYFWPPQSGSSGGSGVTSLNSLTGALSITAGSGISVTPSGTNIIIAATSVGSGTVTSVALVDGSTTPLYAISGSPVTTAGTLTFTLNTQLANIVLAGPTTGGAAQPTFRALVSADIPTLNQNTTGTSSNVTGTVAIAHGGTGAVTAAAAYNALSPMTTTGDIEYEVSAGVAGRLPIGSSGQVLSVLAGIPAWETPTTGTVTTVSVASANGLAGTVATATSTPVITLSTTITGILQGNGTAISATNTTGSGNIVLSASPTLTGTIVAASQTLSGTLIATGAISGSNLTSAGHASADLAIANNLSDVASKTTSFNNLSPMTTLGDIIYGGTSGTGTRLAGNTTTTEKFLSQTGTGSISAVPVWSTLPTVTYVAPTIQTFTSGSGTYLTPTSPAPLYIEVIVQGAGGGGGGASSDSSATSGNSGGNSTFGSLMANGGPGGPANAAQSSIGGGASGGNILNAQGGGGQGGAVATTSQMAGGQGGSTYLGGGTGGGAGGQESLGPPPNTGGGGGGGGASATASSGAGGGGGGTTINIYSGGALLTSYSYAVGAGGTEGATGTNGSAGGQGSNGVIIVKEYYQ